MTYVPEDLVILSGVPGEEWSIGRMDIFLAKFNMIDFVEGDRAGMCSSKPGYDERAAIRMNHPFELYYETHPDTPRKAPAGWWLLQRLRRFSSIENYGAIRPDIFHQRYTRTQFPVSGNGNGNTNEQTAESPKVKDPV